MNDKVELLAPAGDPEKLKIAIHYGADAVYLADKDFSLRNFSGNFTIEEIEEAVVFAHTKGVKVYVACNIYSRNEQQKEIDSYLRRLGEINPDAIIIADPGILYEAAEVIPHIPIHLSTQANTTNYKSVFFWEKFKVKRVNMARELSLSEIKEISAKTGIEIEAFVHGAMCISYSGRCLLSAFLAHRDSNMGMCAHPCRWKYFLTEAIRPDESMPFCEDKYGSYIFNSKDLCMIEHIPEMIESGINSLKIEGRMKSIHYLATVVNVYKSAINAYYSDPDNYRAEKYWKEELASVNARGYCTGFYFNEPDQIVPDYSKTKSNSNRKFIAKVFSDSKIVDFSRYYATLIEARNKIEQGNAIEIIKKGKKRVEDRIIGIYNEDMLPKKVAQPKSIVTIITETECSVNDLMRRRLG